MKLFKKMKDGGNESTVTGYWLIEWKSAFSIVLLRFDGASREAFHTHAFNSLSWVLKGSLREEMRDGRIYDLHPALLPFLTSRKDFHKVSSTSNRTWALSFRGPWRSKWMEHLPLEGRDRVLTHGRREVDV